MSFVPGIGTVQTCAFHRSDRSNDRGGGKIENGLVRRFDDNCAALGAFVRRRAAVGAGENSAHCLSYTAVLVTFFPFASVRVVVTVRLLPSAETTMRPVIVVFPPFFTLTPKVRSSIFVSDRASEFRSPVTG